jgi:2-dehydro-3-deoxyphosphooctonate aldolase (KDO 8-P synthase)
MKDGRHRADHGRQRPPLTVIAGPCQLEILDHALMIADRMAEACAAAGAAYVFKASYDKANRTSLSGKRGVGMAMRGSTSWPRCEGAHRLPGADRRPRARALRPAQLACDILQIPAFLCRQTDLLLAAGETGAAINVKKGQFLAPWDMANVAAKVASTGNDRILLTERGVSFGYNTLVTDMRAAGDDEDGLPRRDGRHPFGAAAGRPGESSGGQREFAPVMARAAVSLGIAAVFIETHEAPDTAPSDGPT